MSEEIKELLIKDFNEILVKEFCTDWEAKRLYIELLINATPFSNLLDYIQQKENIIKEVRELLSKYNDNESNYYAPIDMALYLLDKENKE